MTEGLEFADIDAVDAKHSLEPGDERWRAMAGFDAVFVKVAGWLENSYRAAGRANRAEAVRPSRRRRGLLLKDDVRGAGGRDQPSGATVSRPAKAEPWQRPRAAADSSRQPPRAAAERLAKAGSQSR